MRALPWPLPAVAGWALAWATYLLGVHSGAPAPLGFALATAAGALAARVGSTRWRRLFIAAGFPLSLAAVGAATLPAWAWLAPLALLALLYPARAWRDAPLFPTPAGALDGLADAAPLPAGARVLDAGCGVGDGLIALRRAYPQARIAGVEWSWPLALLCRLRCRYAQVELGDLWARDWSGCDLVYLFQRPESMPRALEKARRELRRGAWLASLEFEVPGLHPVGALRHRARPVWLYRAPF